MPRPVWQRPADLRPGPSVVQGGTLAVLDASPNLIVAIDSSARSSYLTPSDEATFGYTRDELPTGSSGPWPALASTGRP